MNGHVLFHWSSWGPCPLNPPTHPYPPSHAACLCNCTCLRACLYCCCPAPVVAQSVKDMPIVQDMPPVGGFPSIRIQRRLPSTGPTGVAIFAVGGAVMAYGYYQVTIMARAMQSCRGTLVCMHPRLHDKRLQRTAQHSSSGLGRCRGATVPSPRSEAAALRGRVVSAAYSN